MTTPWHVRSDQLADYHDQTSDPVVAASTEAHLLRCGPCRAALARLADSGEAARRWERLADAVDHPSRGGSRLSRVAVGTPPLMWAALISAATSAALPAVASAVHQPRATALLLALAPLIPLTAVAIAYRHASDPVGEIALATPSAGLRLVAMRATAVGLGALPAGVLSGWLSGLSPHVALAWLLPGLALAAMVLASATTRFDPLDVAAGLGATWALAVGAPGSVRASAAAHLVDVVASPAMQLTAVAVGLAAVAVTLSRRQTIAYRRSA
ncbi:hypothetical protein [Angustibacter sp. Root456]|uniref:hypothetical protein n=1 Tax=Angustibacter sp. Root456 TaxID=1736539 RepID=UPI0006FFB87D|nr:hypothetical protein [Angustibacter sp. Root456]KQX64381.1 hypothetical protein ASD06_09355 [Angustibacter sp. Root456]